MSVFLYVIACAQPCADGTGYADGACYPLAVGAADSGHEPGAGPDWGASDVAAVLEAVLARGLPEPHRLERTFLALIATGDATCPPAPDGISLPEGGGCSASTGASFAGVGVLVRRSGTDDGVAYTEYSVRPASFTFTDPAGNTYAGGGEFRFREEESSTGSTFEALVAGTWSYPPDDAWLADGVTGYVEYSGSVGADGARSLTVSGNLGGDAYVYLDTIRWAPSTCDAPEVEILVRHPSGPWFTYAAEACAPCGEVRADAGVLGEACVDVVPAIARAVVEMEARW